MTSRNPLHLVTSSSDPKEQPVPTDRLSAPASRRTVTPARTGLVAYLAVAVIVADWIGAVVVVILAGLVAVVEHHHRARADASGRTRVAHHRDVTPGIVALVLAGGVLLRDGIGRSVMDTILVGVLAFFGGLAVLSAVAFTGHGIPILVGLIAYVVTRIVLHHLPAVRSGRDPTAVVQAGTVVALPGDLALVDYVERNSFPGDTVADFAASATGAVSIEEARRITDAYVAGRAAERFDAYQRRSNAARAAAAQRWGR